MAIAEKVPHGPEAVVHGDKIEKGEAKFKFISVLQSWEEFDVDKHCTGAFLKWPEKATEITTAITFQNPDLLTESETSEMSDTDNLIVVKNLPPIDSVDVLRTSQVLSLFKGDEYIGDGTFFSDSAVESDILPGP